MKTILNLLVIAAIFGLQMTALANDVVVLQSFRVKPYEQALEGFKQIGSFDLNRIILSESKESDVSAKINRSRPDIVLAIGQEALLRAREIEDTPVVYMMVLNPHAILEGQKNITGVSMYIPPETHLDALLDILPYTETIGFLYDPKRSGLFVEQARKIADRKNVRLVPREITDPKQAPSLMMGMQDKIDVFWMLPDLTVIQPETVEFLLLFSFENKIPLFTFSEKYVEMGAFVSMDIDAVDMGRQAGEMALEILSGRRAEKIEPAFARRAIVSTNMMIARKLGINTLIAGNSGDFTEDRIRRKSHVIQ